MLRDQGGRAGTGETVQWRQCSTRTGTHPTTKSVQGERTTKEGEGDIND